MSEKKTVSTNATETAEIPELNSLILTKFDKNINSDVTEPIDLDEIKNDELVISSGDYILSGKYKGTLLIKASDEKVHLFLNNVSIESKTGPTLIIESADKVVITLAEEIDNYIWDNGVYDLSKEYDACIDSTASITFDGDISSSNDFCRFLEGDYCQRPVLPCGESILEIKWDDVLPNHIKDSLKLEDLRWIAFSKYVMTRTYHL